MLFQLALLRPNLAPPRGAVVLEELPFDAVAAAKINFSGMWTRVHSDGLVESLVARGRKQDEAEQIASAPYIMKWERAAKPLVWKVTTMQEDMKTPIRSLEYPLGEWKETIANFDVSAPFDEAGVVARTTSYSPVESAIGGLVHFTRSASPSGCVETVSRYLVEGGMVCTRFLEPTSGGKSYESLELFARLD